MRNKKESLNVCKSNQYKLRNKILCLFIFFISITPFIGNTKDLTWKKVKGSIYYLVEVSKDPKFHKSSRIYKAKDNRYFLNLKPGIYYVRVAGFFGTGKGLFSAVSAVEISKASLKHKQKRKITFYIPNSMIEGEPVKLPKKPVKNKSIRWLNYHGSPSYVRWDSNYKMWIPSNYRNFRDYSTDKGKLK